MAYEPHWYLLIWPDEYDDSEDTGYAWSGPAKDEAEALTFAIAECEAGNDWDPGHINTNLVRVIESGPDKGHAYDAMKEVLKDPRASAAAWLLNTLADIVTATGA